MGTLVATVRGHMLPDMRYKLPEAAQSQCAVVVATGLALK